MQDSNLRPPAVSRKDGISLHYWQLLLIPKSQSFAVFCFASDCHPLLLITAHGPRYSPRYQIRATNPVNGPTNGWYFNTVAVGTTITDRPPHRSVRARLRIRLLRRMSGVEACIRIGVQNAGWRNPPVQDWGETFPTHLCALTAADQNTLP